MRMLDVVGQAGFVYAVNHSTEERLGRITRAFLLGLKELDGFFSQGIPLVDNDLQLMRKISVEEEDMIRDGSDTGSRSILLLRLHCFRF